MQNPTRLLRLDKNVRTPPSTIATDYASNSPERDTRKNLKRTTFSDISKARGRSVEDMSTVGCAVQRFRFERISRNATEHLNWRRIRRLDVGLLEETNDVEAIESLINMFMFSNVSEDDIQSQSEYTLVKLVKLMQLSLEFVFAMYQAAETKARENRKSARKARETKRSTTPKLRVQRDAEPSSVSILNEERFRTFCREEVKALVTRTVRKATFSARRNERAKFDERILELKSKIRADLEVVQNMANERADTVARVCSERARFMALLSLETTIRRRSLSFVWTRLCVLRASGAFRERYDEKLAKARVRCESLEAKIAQSVSEREEMLRKSFEKRQSLEGELNEEGRKHEQLTCELRRSIDQLKREASIRERDLVVELDAAKEERDNLKFNIARLRTDFSEKDLRINTLDSDLRDVRLRLSDVSAELSDARSELDAAKRKLAVAKLAAHDRVADHATMITSPRSNDVDRKFTISSRKEDIENGDESRREDDSAPKKSDTSTMNALDDELKTSANTKQRESKRKVRSVGKSPGATGTSPSTVEIPLLSLPSDDVIHHVPLKLLVVERLLRIGVDTPHLFRVEPEMTLKRRAGRAVARQIERCANYEDNRAAVVDVCAELATDPEFEHCADNFELLASLLKASLSEIPKRLFRLKHWRLELGSGSITTADLLRRKIDALDAPRRVLISWVLRLLAEVANRSRGMSADAIGVCVAPVVFEPLPVDMSNPTKSMKIQTEYAKKSANLLSRLIRAYAGGDRSRVPRGKPPPSLSSSSQISSRNDTKKDSRISFKEERWTCIYKGVMCRAQCGVMDSVIGKEYAVRKGTIVVAVDKRETPNPGWIQVHVRDRLTWLPLKHEIYGYLFERTDIAKKTNRLKIPPKVPPMSTTPSDTVKRSKAPLQSLATPPKLPPRSPMSFDATTTTTTTISKTSAKKKKTSSWSSFKGLFKAAKAMRGKSGADRPRIQRKVGGVPSGRDEEDSSAPAISSSLPTAEATKVAPATSQEKREGRKEKKRTAKHVAKFIARGLRSMSGLKKRSRESRKKPTLDEAQDPPNAVNIDSPIVESSDERSETTSSKNDVDLSRSDSDTSKESSVVRSAPSFARVAEGDRVFGAVETTSQGVVYWFPGVASRIYQDGKADVSFDDDTRMTRVCVCRVANREYNVLKDPAPAPGDQVFGMEEDENDGEMLWRLATVCATSNSDDATTQIRRNKMRIRVLYHGDDSDTPRVPELIWCVVVPTSEPSTHGGVVEVPASSSALPIAGDPYFWDNLEEDEEDEEELRKCVPDLSSEGVSRRRSPSLEDRARSTKLHIGGVPRMPSPPRMPPSPHGTAVEDVNENDMVFEDALPSFEDSDEENLEEEEGG